MTFMKADFITFVLTDNIPARSLTSGNCARLFGAALVLIISLKFEFCTGDAELSGASLAEFGVLPCRSEDC